MAREEDDPTNRQTYPLEADRYRLIQKIGTNNDESSVVYKAYCNRMDSSVELVAVKVIDLEKTRQNKNELMGGAKLMSILDHPNILRAHCSFTLKTKFWVVMPFMSGGSMQSIISTSYSDVGLPEACIGAVLKQILNGLSYLHTLGLVHRDVNPSNILMDSNGGIQLSDFGISSSVYSLPSSELKYWEEPRPGQRRTESDIWLLGVTALELAYGRPPTKSDSDAVEKSKILSDPFKIMYQLCLDEDPSNRPTAPALLARNMFFQNCQGPDFLVQNLGINKSPEKVGLKRKFRSGESRQHAESSSSTGKRVERELIPDGFSYSGPIPIEEDPDKMDVSLENTTGASDALRVEVLGPMLSSLIGQPNLKVEIISFLEGGGGNHSEFELAQFRRIIDNEQFSSVYSFMN